MLKLLLGSMSAVTDTQSWMPIVDHLRPPVMVFSSRERTTNQTRCCLHGERQFVFLDVHEGSDRVTSSQGLENSVSILHIGQ